MVSLLRPDVKRAPYQQTSRKSWPRLAPESSDAFWTCASVLRRSCHIYFYSAEIAGCSHVLNGSSWIPSATVSGSSSGACTARSSAGLVQSLIDWLELSAVYRSSRLASVAPLYRPQISSTSPSRRSSPSSRSPRSPRRPGQFPPPQQVQVQVIDTLSGIAASVGDDAISLSVETVLPGELGGKGKQAPEQLFAF